MQPRDEIPPPSHIVTCCTRSSRSCASRVPCGRRPSRSGTTAACWLPSSRRRSSCILPCVRPPESTRRCCPPKAAGHMASFLSVAFSTSIRPLRLRVVRPFTVVVLCVVATPPSCGTVGVGERCHRCPTQRDRRRGRNMTGQGCFRPERRVASRLTARPQKRHRRAKVAFPPRRERSACRLCS